MTLWLYGFCWFCNNYKYYCFVHFISVLSSLVYIVEFSIKFFCNDTYYCTHKESEYTVNNEELVAIQITFYDKELFSWMVPEDSMR